MGSSSALGYNPHISYMQDAEQWTRLPRSNTLLAFRTFGEGACVESDLLPNRIGPNIVPSSVLFTYVVEPGLM